MLTSWVFDSSQSLLFRGFDANSIGLWLDIFHKCDEALETRVNY